MKLGVRGRLFLVCLAIVLSVELLGGVFLARELRLWHDERVEEDLWRMAHHARQSLALAELESAADVQRVAQLLGQGLGARLSIVAASGEVWGDSHVDGARLDDLDAHNLRPEIRAALDEGKGSSRRRSSSLGRDMLYVALPFERPHLPAGVLRLAVELDAAQSLSHRLRGLLLAAAVLGLFVALLLSWAASFVFSRTLRELVDSTRAVVGLGGDGREALWVDDELGGLTTSVRHMADELEKLVAALAMERDRLEAVLEAMDDVVIALDNERRITLVNESGRLLLGRGDSPVGRLLSDKLNVPSLNDLVQKASDGHSASAEFELPGETERCVMARSTPVGTAGSALVVLQDVTRLRHLETVRRDFVANASHELRTPVSIIQANAETLLDGAIDNPARARQFLEAMARNAVRLSRLMADLLDLSRIESGQYTIHSSHLAVAEAVQEAFGAVLQSAANKRIELDAFIAKDLHVYADAKAFDQVLVNLLDNAIKYTPSGGKVWVRAETLDGDVRIRVCDNGPGVTPAHRERLFERFYRVDTGRSRAMGGTGLGLAIVKHLASCMDGHVGMDALAPQGSCFWVRLPRGIVKDLLDDAPRLARG